MRGKLTVVVVGAGLALASAALAAAPVGGGRYKGSDSSTAPKHSVTIVVTKNGANFKHARFNFALNGQGGLGSCAGPAYVTVTPTRARQISKSGKFALHGTFTFKVPTPYGPVTYKATASIKGSFTDAGKKVSGTLRETASSSGLTCRSGAVHFSAGLVS